MGNKYFKFGSIDFTLVQNGVELKVKSKTPILHFILSFLSKTKQTVYDDIFLKIPQHGAVCCRFNNKQVR